MIPKSRKYTFLGWGEAIKAGYKIFWHPSSVMRRKNGFAKKVKVIFMRERLNKKGVGTGEIIVKAIGSSFEIETTKNCLSLQ